MACNAAVTEKQIQSKIQRDQLRRTTSTSGLTSKSKSSSVDQTPLSSPDGAAIHSDTTFLRNSCLAKDTDIMHSLNDGTADHEISRVECTVDKKLKSVHIYHRNNHTKNVNYEGNEDLGEQNGDILESSIADSNRTSSSGSAKRFIHRNTSASCAAGECSSEDTEESPSLLLDEDSLSRHMCTANISGERREYVADYSARFLSRSD